MGSENVEVSFALRYVDAANGRVSQATATASDAGRRTPETRR